LLYDSPALELQVYIPLGISFGLAALFCGLFTGLAVLVGPKRMTPAKAGPFECGSEPIGSPRARYSTRFYQVAILFLVFDIESAFMYPWAVLYADLSAAPGGRVGMFGFVEMLLFVLVLVVALAYVWRKKAIGWD
jgi:NADH-quinone oxidoreductase subunit A